MSELVFEPYAVQQRWRMSRPLGPDDWAALFSDYLSVLAGACAEPGPVVIGHIKLLALFDGQDYLRVSVVSAAHPPTVTGGVPSSLSEVAVTLNVLVYGLARDILAALTSRIAAATAERWAGHVDEQTSIVSTHHEH